MNTVDALREKYATNEFMRQKLENYLNHLPELMKTIEDNYCKKEEKKKILHGERDTFIHEFTRIYSFFYIPQTDTYVNQENLSVISEDYIVHLIANKLEKSLFASKYKITQAILKKIKDHSIFHATIDTYMMKRIVQSLPFSKDMAQYFLTILGDIILNKRESLIYYIDVSYKPFLKALNQSIYFILNKSFSDAFKHKYHDHNYDSCRVVTGTCPLYEMPDTIRIIITAITYSNKFGNSDGYIASNPLDNAMILHRNTPESLMDLFLSSYMIKEEGTSISYKDVYFLWKTFLRKHYLPFVVSQQNFKSYLAPEGDVCMNLTTNIQMDLLKIKRFWDKYIVYDDENSYELQEIVDMYNKQEKASITMDTMKEVLTVEYPHINIDTTIVLNVTCLLWNKSVDIDNAMEVFKCYDTYSNDIHDMYDFYVGYTKLHHKRCVTQDYFEKYFQ